jgi:hypothetical protein
MTMHVVRGGARRTERRGTSLRDGPRDACRAPHRGDLCQRSLPDLDELSNDPAARRRELLVVLELCAARERGARTITACARAEVGQSAATVPKS